MKGPVHMKALFPALLNEKKLTKDFSTLRIEMNARKVRMRKE